MDWNNDGKIDGRDYAHYKSVINTNDSSDGNYSSNGSLGSYGWIVMLILCLLLRMLASQ